MADNRFFVPNTEEFFKGLAEALSGGGGGSQVACRSFKISRVGVLSKAHVAVGN